MIKSNREYRDMTLAVVEETRAEGDEPVEERKIVSGYATTFDESYVLYEDEEIVIKEQVSSRAFDEADMSDVIFQYDHRGRVFARNKNNTLEVEPDEQGLFIKADLGGTEIGRELYDEIRGGYTDKMSFGFTVSKDSWFVTDEEDGRRSHLRTIEGVAKLYDVSAVSIPANDGTSINATERSIRSLTDGVIEKAKAERLARDLELERKRVALRARAILAYAERNY